MGDFSKVREKFSVKKFFKKVQFCFASWNLPENVDFEAEGRGDVSEDFSFSFFFLHFELDLAELVNFFERGDEKRLVDGDDPNDVFDLCVVVRRRAARKQPGSSRRFDCQVRDANFALGSRRSWRVLARVRQRSRLFCRDEETLFRLRVDFGTHLFRTEQVVERVRSLTTLVFQLIQFNLFRGHNFD